MSAPKIKFGTSGWRGVIADDFTFSRVRAVTQAIADHLAAQGLKDKGVVIGYDTRFHSERFIAKNGIRSFLANRNVHTTVVTFEILRRKAAGGINFTASHNPPEYNGVKFSPAWGGPALPETTGDIERRANEMLGEVCYRELALDDALKQGLLEEIDPREPYLADLATKV